MYKANYVSEGKTTYYVNGKRFMNDTGLRNGKQRAKDYCSENFIDESEIITFDSQLECDRYEYLLEQQKLGNISELKHHYQLPLLPQFTNYNGDEIPELKYNADFVYLENGRRIVEDVKGASLFSDTRFECIKQIFDYKYREKTYIRIIIRRDKQWVEWKLGERKKPQKLIKKQSQKIKELQDELHKKEMQENKAKREKQRLLELSKKDKLTSQEKKRFNELKQKYEERMC